MIMSTDIQLWSCPLTCEETNLGLLHILLIQIPNVSTDMWRNKSGALTYLAHSNCQCIHWHVKKQIWGSYTSCSFKLPMYPLTCEETNLGLLHILLIQIANVSTDMWRNKSGALTYLAHSNCQCIHWHVKKQIWGSYTSCSFKLTMYPLTCEETNLGLLHILLIQIANVSTDMWRNKSGALTYLAHSNCQCIHWHVKKQIWGSYISCSFKLPMYPLTCEETNLGLLHILLIQIANVSTDMWRNKSRALTYLAHSNCQCIHWHVKKQIWASYISCSFKLPMYSIGLLQLKSIHAIWKILEKCNTGKEWIFKCTYLLCDF